MDIAMITSNAREYTRTGQFSAAFLCAAFDLRPQGADLPGMTLPFGGGSPALSGSLRSSSRTTVRH